MLRPSLPLPSPPLPSPGRVDRGTGSNFQDWGVEARYLQGEEL